jgi:hypothetical protein
MTAREMSELVGSLRMLRSGDLWFEVTVEDVRVRFGTVDVQVRPAAGSGTTWVELASTIGKW